MGVRRRPTVTVDISSLLDIPDPNASSSSPRQLRPTFVSQSPKPVASIAAYGRRTPAHATPPIPSTKMPMGRRSMPPQVTDQPVKKQSKWSADEDALIIELRGRGMKWEDVSKRLPGRSAISCRLHYQNYLERRSEWDEERKNKLARLYERFKADMWAKVAEELAIPWRAAEAMHWQLGEGDMARRAGVVPFSLAAVNVESNQRNLSSRGHGHSQSQESVGRDSRTLSPRSSHARNQQMAGININYIPHRDPTPVPIAPPTLPHSAINHEYHEYHEPRSVPGPGLAPMQGGLYDRHSGPLPGVAELTTGLGPYKIAGSRPVAMYMAPNMMEEATVAPNTRAYSTPTPEPTGSKRRASIDLGQQEPLHRRRIG